MRPREVETMTEEKYFSSMEYKSGKKVTIGTRKIGTRISRQLYPDASMLTDPVPDDFWAEKENHHKPMNIEDGKKSLRRNKYHGSSSGYGTAERKKKHKLSTLPRDHRLHCEGSSEEVQPPQKPTYNIVVENIDIDDPKIISKSMTEHGNKSPRGKSPSNRSPLERSLSCDLRPPNISPFDGQKEWEAIESIMARFVTQTSTTSTTSSDHQNDSSDQHSSDQAAAAACEKSPQIRKKPEVPKRPSLQKIKPSNVNSLDSIHPDGCKSQISLLPVIEWTNVIGLDSKIAQNLVEHGFDDLRFMVIIIPLIK